MKVQKLGLDWGAAYEEAAPVRISHVGAEITAFVNSTGGITVDLPPDAKLDWTEKGIRVIIPTAD